MLRRAPDERLPTEARRSRVRVRERASRSLCVGTCAHGQRQRTRAALRTGDPALGRRQRVSHVAECARQWRAGVQGTPPLPAPVAPELGRPGRASNNGMLANRTRERRAQRSSNRARERARPTRMLMRRRSSTLYFHCLYILVSATPPSEIHRRRRHRARRALCPTLCKQLASALGARWARLHIRGSACHYWERPPAPRKDVHR